MRTFSFLSLAVASLLVVSCSDYNEPEVVEEQEQQEESQCVFGTAEVIELTPTQTQINEAQGEFAFNFIKAFNEKTSFEGDSNYNFAISPFGAYQQLGLVANTLEGESLEKLLGILGHSSIDELNGYNAYLIEQLPAVDPSKVSFTQAFAAWLNTDYELHNVDAFEETIDMYYDAPVSYKSFYNDLATVDSEYYQWVKEKTNGTFKGRINILSSWKSLLTHCFVFDGKWYKSFLKENTEELPFYTEDGTLLANVPTMNGVQMVETINTDNAVIYKLYYGDGGYSLKLLLPNEGVSLNDAVASVDFANWKSSWAAVKDNIYRSELRVYLPRFEMGFRSFYMEYLAKMGMDSEVQTSLYGTGSLSTLYQHGMFCVEESGTRVVAVSTQHSVISNVPKVVRFDRPFALFLEEESTGAILLFGKINNPTLSSAAE